MTASCLETELNYAYHFMLFKQSHTSMKKHGFEHKRTVFPALLCNAQSEWLIDHNV